MRWSDGSIFNGIWHKDQRHRGKMIMFDRTIYEG